MVTSVGEHSCCCSVQVELCRANQGRTAIDQLAKERGVIRGWERTKGLPQEWWTKASKA